jgi:hypothetical protein
MSDSDTSSENFDDIQARMRNDPNSEDENSVDEDLELEDDQGGNVEPNVPLDVDKIAQDDAGQKVTFTRIRFKHNRKFKLTGMSLKQHIFT